MLLVVASAEGGTNLARSITVCKDFAKFRDDDQLLKMANFDNFSLLDSVVHFQHINSLLIKCAEAGNDGARYILAKVILIGFSQLREEESNCSVLLRTDQASTSTRAGQNALRAFLYYFRRQRAIGSSNVSKFSHFEYVRYFVSKCSFLDLVCMLPHVEKYVKYFGAGTFGFLKFSKSLGFMLVIIRAIVDVGGNRTCEIHPQMRDAQVVLNSVRRRYLDRLIRRSNKLSWEEWQGLKKECKYIAEELLTSGICAKTKETNNGVLNMEKRFFYYVAFNEPPTREMDFPSDAYLVDLQSECKDLAMAYNNHQRDAIKAFDEIFFSRIFY